MNEIVTNSKDLVAAMGRVPLKASQVAATRDNDGYWIIYWK